MTADFVKVPVAKLIKLRNRAAAGDGNEAENAAARLRELLGRYGLDETYLLEVDVVERMLDAETDFNRMRLADALAKSRSCRAGVRKNVGLVLRGPRRFACDAEAIYKKVIETAHRYDVFAQAPQSVAVAFRKVFWATFIDRVILRLAPEVVAPEDPSRTEVTEATGESSRKQYDFAQNACAARGQRAYSECVGLEYGTVHFGRRLARLLKGLR